MARASSRRYVPIAVRMRRERAMRRTSTCASSRADSCGSFTRASTSPAIRRWTRMRRSCSFPKTAALRCSRRRTKRSQAAGDSTSDFRDRTKRSSSTHEHSRMTERLLHSLVSTEPLAVELEDAAVLAALLDVEVALARVEGRLGLIPAGAADAIAAAAARGDFDAPAIARAARESGTLAIPVVE